MEIVIIEDRYTYYDDIYRRFLDIKITTGLHKCNSQYIISRSICLDQYENDKLFNDAIRMLDAYFEEEIIKIRNATVQEVKELLKDYGV